MCDYPKLFRGLGLTKEEYTKLNDEMKPFALSSEESPHAILWLNQEWNYKNAKEWSNITSGSPNRSVCPNGSDPQA